MVSDATELLQGAIDRFVCFKEPPISYFMVFNFKIWTYEESELRQFGHDAIDALVEAFQPALHKANASTEGIRSEGGKLKRRVLPLQTSPLLPVYTDLLKA